MLPINFTSEVNGLTKFLWKATGPTAIEKMRSLLPPTGGGAVSNKKTKKPAKAASGDQSSADTGVVRQLLEKSLWNVQFYLGSLFSGKLFSCSSSSSLECVQYGFAI